MARREKGKERKKEREREGEREREEKLRNLTYKLVIDNLYERSF